MNEDESFVGLSGKGDVEMPLLLPCLPDYEIAFSNGTLTTTLDFTMPL
jgi:hypothetical protein